VNVLSSTFSILSPLYPAMTFVHETLFYSHTRSNLEKISMKQLIHYEDHSINLIHLFIHSFNISKHWFFKHFFLSPLSVVSMTFFNIDTE
jgi:siderophore synthetase component